MFVYVSVVTSPDELSKDLDLLSMRYVSTNVCRMACAVSELGRSLPSKAGYRKRVV